MSPGVREAQQVGPLPRVAHALLALVAAVVSIFRQVCQARCRSGGALFVARPAAPDGNVTAVSG